jgi:hypothetical protein
MQSVINVILPSGVISRGSTYKVVRGSIYIVQTVSNCLANHTEYRVMGHYSHS